jgi:transcriptional regulator with XRE-family HTH domain
MLANKDLGPNLRLLCSYGKSISQICRQAGINRHQLQRYLKGSSEPSLNTLRRICDFFGLDEHEILLPHAAFAELIRIRPPRLQQTRDPISEYMGGFIDAQDLGIAKHYEGFYHVYFQPNRLVPEIHRALTRITLEDRSLVTKTIERYITGHAGLPPVVKYKGIAFTNGSSLTMIESRSSTRASTFYSVLYGADTDALTVLTGLAMGVSPDSSRVIYCIRTCWQYLGKQIDLRQRIRECGQLPLTSVGDYVRNCIQNDIAPQDEVFSPRY